MTLLHRPVFWVFLSVFLARLWVLAALVNSPYLLPDQGDMRFYHEWALRILRGEWTDGRAFYGLPGYAWLLAAIYALCGVNPFAVGLLQAGADAAVAVFIYHICESVFKDKNGCTVGVLAAAGWAVFLPAQTFSTIVMPTVWLVVSYWGCVLWLLKGRRHTVWHPWFWMGLLVGIVSMVVATVLCLVPLLIAGMVDRLRKPIAVAAATGLLLAGVATGLAPCALHNYLVAGEPVLLSAHSGINFYIGNNERADGYPKMPPGMRASQSGMLQDSITIMERAAGRPLSRAEVSQLWFARAHQYIREHPWQWLRLMGRKVRNLWSAYQYDDLSMVPLLEWRGILLPGPRFGLVAALALPGVLLAVRRFPKSSWVLAAVLLHMAALLPVFVTERYRLAAVPGLLVFAGYFVVDLAQTTVAWQWHRLAGRLGLGLLAALAVGWPRAEQSLWSRDAYNVGISLIEAGLLDEAQRHLEEAFCHVPGNAGINFALGNLWLAKGNRTRAKQFYRRALELDPRDPSLLNNLGVLAMQEKRWSLAEKFFAGSLAAEPENAKGHYLLAKVLLELGDREAARRAIETAITQDPTQPLFQQFRDAVLPQTE